MRRSMTLTEINRLAQTPKAFVAQCHTEFNMSVQALAEHIQRENVHFVYLSGPTSSGKTTFANTLSHYMKGRNMIPLSLDDFFRSQQRLRRKKDGSKDYESIYTIDMPKLQRVMRKLQAGETTPLPRFDFKNGKVIDNHSFLTPHKDNIYIIEGIHALNKKISSLSPKEDSVKVYVAPTGQVVGDNGVAVNPNDFRFIRRMIRDNYHRSAPPELTFTLWKNVRDGEKRYAYGKEADFKIDTFLFCEPCVLREEGLKLLHSMKHQSRKVKRLVKILQCFPPISSAFLPETSILREFLNLDIENGNKI